MELGGQTNWKVDSKRLRLSEAISAGRLYQTKMILENKPNLNFIDGQGLSPLLRALMIQDEKHRTRIAMVKLLLQHNVDVNLRDNQGRHALALACRMNKLDLVKLLFEKRLQDVDLTSQDVEGNTPLMYAVENNNVDMLRLLVNAMRKFSLSVDQRNCEDKTPYYRAMEMGFEECARVLSDDGKASQSIQVNPFVDFVGINKADFSEKVRVSSAPTAKGCTRRGAFVGRKHVVYKRRRVTKDVDGDRKIITKKKQGTRLQKFRRVTCKVSQKTPNHNENTLKSGAPEAVKGVESLDVRDTKKRMKQHCGDRKGTAILVENSMRKKSEYVGKDDRERNEKNLKNFPEKNTTADREESFLRLILARPASGTSRRSQTPVSCISTNPPSRSISQSNKTQERHKFSFSSTNTAQDRHKCVVPVINNFLDFRDARKKDAKSELGIVCHARPFTAATTDNTSTKLDSNYYTYLEWKASLDASPNTLRNLLALRAEQHSEISSYRKGHPLPKYEPQTDESGEDRCADTVPPVSEPTVKLEAVRKISAVTKIIGLPTYLSNRRSNGAGKIHGNLH